MPVFVFMKVNWDKFLWSWPMMLLNACCFVLMLFVFAEGCRQTKEMQDRKEAERIINIIKAAQ